MELKYANIRFKVRNTEDIFQLTKILNLKWQSHLMLLGIKKRIQVKTKCGNVLVSYDSVK